MALLSKEPRILETAGLEGEVVAEQYLEAVAELHGILEPIVVGHAEAELTLDSEMHEGG